MAIGDFPPAPGWTWSDAYGWQPTTTGHITFMPPGCICPPTSEKTCENPACPRQNPFKRNAAGNDLNRP